MYIQTKKTNNPILPYVFILLVTAELIIMASSVSVSSTQSLLNPQNGSANTLYKSISDKILSSISSKKSSLAGNTPGNSENFLKKAPKSLLEVNSDDEGDDDDDDDSSASGTAKSNSFADAEVESYNVFTNVEVDNSEQAALIIEAINDSKEVIERAVNSKGTRIQKRIEKDAETLEQALSDIATSVMHQISILSDEIAEIEEVLDDSIAEQLLKQVQSIVLKLYFEVDYLKDQYGITAGEYNENNYEMTELEYELSKLSDQCSQYADCYSCTLNLDCGWCRTTQQCAFGRGAGPYNGVCSFWDYGTCPGADCLQFTNCKSCLSNPFCGWCDNGEGVSGCIEEKFDFQGCENWFHGLGQNRKCDREPAHTLVDPNQKIDWDAVVYSKQHDFIEDSSLKDAAEIKKELKELGEEQTRLKEKMESLQELIKQAEAQLRSYEEVIGEN